MFGDFHADGDGVYIHLFGCMFGSEMVRQRLDNAGGGAAVPKLGDTSLLPFTTQDLARLLHQASPSSPTNRFVPSVSVIGRSVFSRTVRQGIPIAVVSSCTPPESVIIKVASL